MNLVLDSTVLVGEIIGKGAIWLFILESQLVGTTYIMVKQCYVAMIRPSNIGNVHRYRFSSMRRHNADLMADVVENIGSKLLS